MQRFRSITGLVLLGVIASSLWGSGCSERRERVVERRPQREVIVVRDGRPHERDDGDRRVERRDDEHRRRD
jgi:hypothetical protein